MQAPQIIDKLGPAPAPLSHESVHRAAFETLRRELAAVSDAAVLAIDANHAAAVALALSDRAAKLREDAAGYINNWRIANRQQRAAQAEALATYNDTLAGLYATLANGQAPVVEIVCAPTSEAG